MLAGGLKRLNFETQYKARYHRPFILTNRFSVSDMRFEMQEWKQAMSTKLVLRTKKLNDLLFSVIGLALGLASFAMTIFSFTENPAIMFQDRLSVFHPILIGGFGYSTLIISAWMTWVIMRMASLFLIRVVSPHPYLVLSETGFTVLWRLGPRHFNWTDAETIEFSSTDHKSGELLIKVRDNENNSAPMKFLKKAMLELGVWAVLPEQNSKTPFSEIEAFFDAHQLAVTRNQV